MLAKKCRAMLLVGKHLLRGLGFSIFLCLLLCGRVVAGPTAEIAVTVTVSSDVDEDGLPDDWELQYFGHLDYGPEDDPDGDGYTNQEEYEGGSDPGDDTSLPFRINATVEFRPDNWNVNWVGQHHGQGQVTCHISLGAHRVETTIQTSGSQPLEPGMLFGDFTLLTAIYSDEVGKYKEVQGIELEFGGQGENPVDIIAYSKEMMWEFHDLEDGDIIVFHAVEGNHLGAETILVYHEESSIHTVYDILPETILLNGSVPIIPGSAKIRLRQPDYNGPDIPQAVNVTTERASRNHIHLDVSGLANAQSEVELVVAGEMIFSEEPFWGMNWNEEFTVEERTQKLHIHADEEGRILCIHTRELADEAVIYIDNTQIATIAPDTEGLVLEVRFNKFEAIASMPDDLLALSGGWEVVPEPSVTPPTLVEVEVTGTCESDGDSETHDWSFGGIDAIDIKGEHEKDYEPEVLYEWIQTSGSKPVDIGDEFGDFEVTGFTEIPEDGPKRLDLTLQYTGKYAQIDTVDINVYDKDEKLIGNLTDINMADEFTIDGSSLDAGHLGPKTLLEYYPVDS